MLTLKCQPLGGKGRTKRGKVEQKKSPKCPYGQSPSRVSGQEETLKEEKISQRGTEFSDQKISIRRG